MERMIANYSLKEYLGSGEYGKVYRAVDKETSMQVAIKVVPIHLFKKVDRLLELTKNQLETIRILESNINVVKFVELVRSKFKVYLVYEYCEGGTLFQYLQAKGALKEREAMNLFKQLVNAFRALNDNNVLHRDVKTSNIFLKSGHLKLADFGFCKLLRVREDVTRTVLGSPFYMAPEVINGDPYGSKADMWSCGVVLYEMLFGRWPLSGYSLPEIIQVHRSDKMSIDFPTDEFPISPVIEGMLRRMLQRDQYKRISWDEFFYEYSISEYGVVSHKERDFQFDLFKIKRRSEPVRRFQKQKFNIDNLLSPSFEPIYDSGEQSLQPSFLIRRKIKEYEAQHKVVLELSQVLELMTSTPYAHRQSQELLYIICTNMCQLMNQVVFSLKEYLKQNREFLLKHQAEDLSLNKLLVVFSNEMKQVGKCCNAIRGTVLSHTTFDSRLHVYPSNLSLVCRWVRQYLKRFSPQVLSLNKTTENSSVWAAKKNEHQTTSQQCIKSECILAKLTSANNSTPYYETPPTLVPNPSYAVSAEPKTSPSVIQESLFLFYIIRSACLLFFRSNNFSVRRVPQNNSKAIICELNRMIVALSVTKQNKQLQNSQ